ncbi:MAG: adenylate cyclase [Candidatus Marinimicrobia bacterium]|nr:adenylate cyclase [Candidatus Neomarinimicrobiota bacterium]
MSNLQSTVIMKTDLAKFTDRVAISSESDLTKLLGIHKNIVTDVVSGSGGRIVKGEGDSFWIVFPSVTTAAIAAVEIQQELQIVQAGLPDDRTLQIRIAITLGDVLHQENDIFGDSANLAARIEAITPPNEIYLSQCAWLALNKAEIGNSFVDRYNLKGINEAERVYKINQKHKTRIIKNQFIVFTDAALFRSFVDSESMERVEAALAKLEHIMHDACEEYGGIIRQTIADAFFITFSEADFAFKCLLRFGQNWQEYIDKNDMNLHIRIGVSKGTLNIFRSFIYGTSVDIAARLESWGRYLYADQPRTLVVLKKSIFDQCKSHEILERMSLVNKDVILKNYAEVNNISQDQALKWFNFTTEKLKEDIYEFIIS